MVDLMGKKYYFFALSALIIIAGIVAYIVNGGMVLDIQFQGGTILEIQMKDGNFDPRKAEDIVKNTVGKIATAQKSETYDSSGKNPKVYLLTINIANKQGSLTGDEQTKLVEALRKEFDIPADAQMNVNNVAPFIGTELLSKGLQGVFWASVLIILYMWWRFQVMSGLSAGVTAILALLHDALIMLSIYAIFRVPVNDAFIAAVLTVIGYSMNDTIIIYDRIRENSNLLKKTPIAELVNRSIIQTLSRSINTVVTVEICMITVYAFAAYYNITSIMDFTLPLIVGITSGCYSSIFIASPLWVMWKESRAKKKVASKSAKA
ncbi:MAG: protein translocase subunit SecF [Clostridiales bacterium]|jgi:preprotein translocase subunit SecF|nr:protein translocase subunit SecF [Eubacteriales bacterium]MDH7565312.1 protein translocase subunit SecF [Clostridiales bacterium]